MEWLTHDTFSTPQSFDRSVREGSLVVLRRALLKRSYEGDPPKWAYRPEFDPTRDAAQQYLRPPPVAARPA